MKKSEFKKLLKKEKHPVIKHKMFLLPLALLYIIILSVTCYLNIKEILPLGPFVLINSITIGVFGIPIIYFDLKSDFDIKKLYKKYQNDGGIGEVKNQSHILIILLVLAILYTIASVSFVLVAYAFNDRHLEHLKIINTLDVKDGNGKIVKTEYYSYENDAFYLKIPNSFRYMTEEEMDIKYPLANRPDYIYTDNTTKVNIAVGMQETRLTNSLVKSTTKTTAESFETLYETNVEYDFYEQDKHTIGRINFKSDAEDGYQIYNHILIFVVNDKLTLININCADDLYAEYQPVLDFIADSLIFYY